MGVRLTDRGGADLAQAFARAIMGGLCESRILGRQGPTDDRSESCSGCLVKSQIKDPRAALDVAGKLGLQLPLTKRVCELFVALAQTGKEESDYSALILQLEAMQPCAPPSL